MNVEPTPPEPDSSEIDLRAGENDATVDQPAGELFSAATVTLRSESSPATPSPPEPASPRSGRGSPTPSDPQVSPSDPQVSLSSPRASSIPTEMGRFHHIEVVKSGGFGIVCRAQDSQAGRVVALKFPRQEKLRDRSDLQMFVDEANRAMELDHPGIVKTYAVEEADGLLAIVQDFIDGTDLRSEQTALTNHQVIATLIAKVADALGYAHRRGVYHRDLKPANILLDRQGNPYITDFGLAMHEREQLFLPRQRCGTPHYMPPEQVAGLTRRLDGRSDIWSLGVILYELLTQRKPFQGTNEQEIFDQIEHNDPRPPRQIDPTIDRELQRICLKCLERQQRDRYPTADDLAEDLRHWIANPTPERAGTVIRFIPRGLRPFTTEDADFFLELIPGSRDRAGLPTSLKFWLNRIVSPTSLDLVVPVGVLFGPSGCGKSSFVRAGLLPRLSPEVIPVVIDCTAADTEARLLKSLLERLEGVPTGIDLVTLSAGLAQGLWRPKGKAKVLIVLDQLEQRLSHGDDWSQADLVKALRYCDGRVPQALVLCRDDFLMHLSRFTDSLGMDLREGDNAQAIDLFDRKHARRVLIQYGQAFGQLPDAAAELTPAQENFLTAVINELAEADFIVCMRLVLFAEMFRERPWTLAELSAVGGVSGIGEKFLDANFGPMSRDKRRRSQAVFAQRILAALLPAPGSEIRSGSHSEAELRTVAGLESEPEVFAAVLQSLDLQLKLITRVEAPTATPRDAAPSNALPSLVYQLTHDTMIPAIRSWLERQSNRTRAGRARLRLRELGQQVLPGQPPRYLPSHGEWLAWQWWLRKEARTPTEQTVWQAARRRFSRDLGLAVSGLLVVGLAAIGWLDHQTRLEREKRVEREIHQLVTSQIERIPDVLAQLDQWPAEVQPRLRTQYETLPAGSADRLRIALGRLPAEPSLQPELLAAALAPETLPEPLTVIVRRLARLGESHPVDWAANYRDPNQDLRTRFRAFVAEVSLAAEASPEWAGHAPLMATAFAAEPSPTWRAWLERLQPAREALLPAFQDWFARDYPNPEPMALGVLACQPNSTKAMEQWVQELPTWKTSQFHAALNAVVLRDLKNQFVMAARQRWTGESDPWAQASLGVALARCGEIGPLVELYSQDTESSSAILAVHASVPDRLPPLSLRQIYQQFPLSQMEQTSLRRSMLLALALQAPVMVDTGLRDWLAEVAFHHVVHDPDACCFSAAELILRRLGHDPVQRGRPERRARSNPDGVWGQVLVDHTGLAFSLLPAPGTNDGTRQIAVCTTELTLQELLHFLQQNPAADREFGNPRDQARIPDDAPPHARVPFLHRRKGNDLALVYDYCNWLSRQNQIPESEWCYPLWVDLEKIRSIVVQPQGLGFRLLTTAEWQSANRSAEALQSARSPDGPVMLNYAWYHDNAKLQTPAVGLLLPNANGLYDMFGNVEEVCHSTTIIDAGFYMMGRTVRAQLSGLSNQPIGVAGAPLPADHIHEFHTGFRIARMIQSDRPAE